MASDLKTTAAFSRCPDCATQKPIVEGRMSEPTSDPPEACCVCGSQTVAYSEATPGSDGVMAVRHWCARHEPHRCQTQLHYQGGGRWQEVQVYGR
jgi:hypothetical protein